MLILGIDTGQGNGFKMGLEIGTEIGTGVGGAIGHSLEVNKSWDGIFDKLNEIGREHQAEEQRDKAGNRSLVAIQMQCKAEPNIWSMTAVWRCFMI